MPDDAQAMPDDTRVRQLADEGHVYLRRWQGRLQLQHWSVRLQVEQLQGERAAELDVDYGHYRAVLKIAHDHRPGAVLEDSVLHELGHLVGQPMKSLAWHLILEHVPSKLHGVFLKLLTDAEEQQVAPWVRAVLYEGRLDLPEGAT